MNRKKKPDVDKFREAPDYLTEDWPKDNYLLFPNDIILSIPAKDLVLDKKAIPRSNRLRETSQGRNGLADVDDRNDDKAELGRTIKKRIQSRKLDEQRRIELEIKAFGKTKQRNKKGTDIADFVLRTVKVDPPPATNRDAVIFMKEITRRETKTMDIFELLSEAQQRNKIQNRRRFNDNTNQEKQQRKPAYSDSSSSSDDENSVEEFTAEAVRQRLLSMKVSDPRMQGMLLQWKRRHIQQEIDENPALVIQRKLSVLIKALNFLIELRRAGHLLNAQIKWSTPWFTDILIRMQRRFRLHLFRGQLRKIRVSVRIIQSFCRMVRKKLKFRQRRDAIMLVVQCIRDHSKRKNIPRVIRQYRRNIMNAQRAARALIHCRNARLSLLLKFAANLGLSYDKYPHSKYVMHGLFTEKLVEFIAATRKEFIASKDSAKTIIARGDGIFHKVKRADVKQFLLASRDSWHFEGLPIQVSPLEFGISQVVWKLFSRRDLEDQIRAMYQWALEIGRLTLEQQHMKQTQSRIAGKAEPFSKPSSSDLIRQQNIKSSAGFRNATVSGSFRRLSVTLDNRTESLSLTLPFDDHLQSDISPSPRDDVAPKPAPFLGRSRIPPSQQQFDKVPVPPMFDSRPTGTTTRPHSQSEAIRPRSKQATARPHSQTGGRRFVGESSRHLPTPETGFAEALALEEIVSDVESFLMSGHESRRVHRHVMDAERFDSRSKVKRIK